MSADVVAFLALGVAIYSVTRLRSIVAEIKQRDEKQNNPPVPLVPDVQECARCCERLHERLIATGMTRDAASSLIAPISAKVTDPIAER